jgi:hypothetical protein
MKGDKTIAVISQSVTGVSAVGSLVAFYDIPGRKGEVLCYFLSRKLHRTIYNPLHL